MLDSNEYKSLSRKPRFSEFDFINFIIFCQSEGVEVLRRKKLIVFYLNDKRISAKDLILKFHDNRRKINTK